MCAFYFILRSTDRETIDPHCAVAWKERQAASERAISRRAATDRAHPPARF